MGATNRAASPAPGAPSAEDRPRTGTDGRRTAKRDNKVLTNLSPLLYELSVSDGARGTSGFSAQQKQRPRPTAGKAHELLVSGTNGNPEVLVSSGSQKASELQSSFMM